MDSWIFSFNGKDEKTIKGNVLIENNLIKKISVTAIITDKSGNTVIIDGMGKFLMPGLIDAHSHVMMESIPIATAMGSDKGFINLFAANAAEKQLLGCFTTVRDLGGASISLKRAIDGNLAKGPRNPYPQPLGVIEEGVYADLILVEGNPIENIKFVENP